MNVTDAFFYQCRLNPFGAAVGAADNSAYSLKYAELGRLVGNAAGFVLKAGLDRQKVAGIAVSEMTMHLALTLALARLGIPSIALGRHAPPAFGKIDVVFHGGQIPHGYTGASVLVDAKTFEGDVSPVSPTQPVGQDDVFRFFTSSNPLAQGSTIALTHRLMTSRTSQFGHVAGRLSARASRVFCGFGVSSWQGLTCTMHALSTGGTVYFPAEDAGASLQSFELFQFDGLYTSSAELEAMLAFFEATPVLECSLRFVVCEGALPPALTERVRKRICHDLFFAYGSTETAFISSGPAELQALVPGAVGFFCPGVNGGLSDGQLVVRSPYLPTGYVGGKRTAPPFFRDGAFYSGIAAEVTSDGILALRQDPAGQPPGPKQ